MKEKAQEFIEQQKETESKSLIAREVNLNITPSFKETPNTSIGTKVQQFACTSPTQEMMKLKVIGKWN